MTADNFALVVLFSIHPAILGGVILAHLLHDRRTFQIVKYGLGPKWAAPVFVRRIGSGTAILTADCLCLDGNGTFSRIDCYQ